MNEIKRASLYIERALFFIGGSKAGKSTQICSMFRDRRLGSEGKVPKPREGDRSHALSNERWLYIRRSSPHEMRAKDGTTTQDKQAFLAACRNQMKVSQNKARRWNFVCPLWPDANPPTPSAVELIRAFIKEFDPERVRVVLPYPGDKNLSDQKKIIEAHREHLKRLSDLRKLPRTETIVTHWRDMKGKKGKNVNGLIYMDFFDFT